MESTKAVLAGVRAAFTGHSQGWNLRCESEEGGYVMFANHPASTGLVIETATDDTDRAIRMCADTLQGSREVAIADAAPALDHAELVMGIRTLVTGFDWPAGQVTGLTFLLAEHGAVTAEEAAWLSGYVAWDAPMKPIRPDG